MLPRLHTLPLGLCICRDPNCKIPYGECHCGCGRKTKIAEHTWPSVGTTKGQPGKWLHGHSGGLARTTQSLPGACICGKTDCGIPYGTCHCNCGSPVGISTNSDISNGWIKGLPRLYSLGHTRNTSTVEKRLLKHRRIDERTGCWLWTAAVDDDGYGLIKVKGTMKRVPRVAFEMYRGEIPKGEIVLHSCDNPPCFNPMHLESGTHQKNRQDAFARGRVTAEMIRQSCMKRSGKKATKTHCGRGHEYTTQNTYMAASGSRYCYACARLMRKLRRKGKLEDANRNSSVME
jgi:HNH endonuclease